MAGPFQLSYHGAMVEAALSARCWSCGRAIEPLDQYCRSCGAGQGEHVAWYYRHWGIAVCTLLGLGPFGLILVWRSPCLKRSARWIWTAAIVLLAAYIVRQAFLVWAALSQQMPDIMRLSGQL